MSPRLSVLIVARNEAARLPDCLASTRFAAGIVVVPDRTSGASAAIAEKAGGRVIEGARRRAGRDGRVGTWVLELDADERVQPALAAEIRATIATGRFAWHQVAVDKDVGEPLIRHGRPGSFGTTSVPRLSGRGAERWRMQRVHPGFDRTGEEGPPLARGALTHLVDRDISDMLKRLDRYSSAKPADLLASGEVGTLARNLRRFVSRFGKAVMARRVWREGGWGVLLAFCAGAFPRLAYLKAKLEPGKHGG